MAQTDIDIDFADRTAALDGLPHIAAVEMHSGRRRRHVCGVYLQDVPCDPLDGMAIWEYNEASERGYTKIDFINNSIYEGVRDEDHLRELLREPPWDLFDDPEVVGVLAHLKSHFSVVKQIRPRCVLDLAICLALPRPGKRHLIGQPRHIIDQEIWQPCHEIYFKKAHSIAYAHSLIVQLNLLIEKACRG